MGFAPRSFFRAFTLIYVVMNVIAASSQERLPIQTGWAIQSSAKLQDRRCDLHSEVSGGGVDTDQRA